MTFCKTKNNIKPRKNFYEEIEKHYSGISKEIIPTELLNQIIVKVTDKIYTDYQRFWKQYPKSRKRYSELKLEDLEHDFVYFLITDYLKESEPEEFRNYSKVLLEMNDVEFDKYEKRKWWYENK